MKAEALIPWILALGGGGSDPGQAKTLGYLSGGETLPTTRPDGSALVNGDNYKISVTATLPIEVTDGFTGDVYTLTNVKDTVGYVSGKWEPNLNPYQNTLETPTKDMTTESLSGTATRQNKVNEEFVEKINEIAGLVITAGSNTTIEGGKYTVPDLTWSRVKKIYDAVNLGKQVIVIDANGKDYYKVLDVSKDDNDEITVNFIYKDKAFFWFTTDEGDTKVNSSTILQTWDAITEVEGSLPTVASEKKTNTIYKLKNSIYSYYPDGYYYFKSGSPTAIEYLNLFYSYGTIVVDGVTVPNLTGAIFKKMLDALNNVPYNKLSFPAVSASDSYYPVVRFQRVHGSVMHYKLTLWIDYDTVAVYDQPANDPTATPTITIYKDSNTNIVLEVSSLPSSNIKRNCLYRLTSSSGTYNPGYYYYNGSTWKLVSQDTLTFAQDTLSDTWEIEHNKNSYPSVAAYDSTGRMIEGHVIYNDKNNLTIEFSSPVAGLAYLN